MLRIFVDPRLGLVFVTLTHSFSFAISFAISALRLRGSFKYSRNALEDQRPVDLMSSSENPSDPSIVASPARKLCEEIEPCMFGSFSAWKALKNPLNRLPVKFAPSSSRKAGKSSLVLCLVSDHFLKALIG